MKTCVKCGVDKPVEEFNKAKANKDGLYSYCRDCMKAYQRARREALKEIKQLLSSDLSFDM